MYTFIYSAQCLDSVTVTRELERERDVASCNVAVVVISGLPSFGGRATSSHIPAVKLCQGTMRLAALTTLLATRAASSFRTHSPASVVSGTSLAFGPAGTSSATTRSFRSSASILKMSAEQDKEALINCPTISLRDGTKL